LLCRNNFLITVNPSPAIDARPVEVLKCDANFVVDDLGNGEYYEFAGGPSSTNPVLLPGLVITTSKDYMCCCCNLTIVQRNTP
jgi:hypothetical protein